MHNGNLLNALLGTTGNAPAAKKPVPQNTSAESSARFQEAMEQARPQVAAREPLARKPASRPEPATRAESRPEPARNDDLSRRTDVARKNTDIARKNEEARKADASRSDSAAARATGDAKVDNNSDSPATASLPGKASTGTTNTKENKHADTDVALGEGDKVQDAVAVTTDNAVLAGLQASANALPSTLSLDPLNLVGALTPAAVLNSDALTEVSTAITDPLLDATLAATTSTLVPAEVGDDVAATSALLAVNPLANPQAGTALTGVAAATVLDEAAAALALTGMAATTEGEGDATDAITASLLPGSADDAMSLDNPDFALLSGKASFNKLLEAQLGAGDKTAAAAIVDPAKPALTTAAAAVESLNRFAEAQSPAARSFVVQTGVPVPVGHPQWNQAVGDKVLWLAAQNVSSAEIRLDPPDLGPMHVKVTVNQDQANISFSSPHAVVRDALDQQLSRLRDMFAEQGMNLVNVDVSDKSFAQQERDGQQTAQGQQGLEQDDEELAPVAISQPISIRLVDHYA